MLISDKFTFRIIKIRSDVIGENKKEKRNLSTNFIIKKTIILLLIVILFLLALTPIIF